VAACGPYKANVNTSPLQESERVVLLDSALTRYLNVVKHKSDRLDAGQLEIKLAVENEENEDVWCDVQVIFRDADGFELEKTSWEPVQFHRRKVTTFKRNSLSAKASDYRVLIRNIK
jgi:uncharacterized protein YcfL